MGILLRWIDMPKYHKSTTHRASAKVRWRSSTVEPNVSESMSSVAVAYTLPAAHSAAHWASASHGACSR